MKLRSLCCLAAAALVAGCTTGRDTVALRSIRVNREVKTPVKMTYVGKTESFQRSLSTSIASAGGGSGAPIAASRTPAVNPDHPLARSGKRFAPALSAALHREFAAAARRERLRFALTEGAADAVLSFEITDYGLVIGGKSEKQAATVLHVEALLRDLDGRVLWHRTESFPGEEGEGRLRTIEEYSANIQLLRQDLEHAAATVAVSFVERLNRPGSIRAPLGESEPPAHSGARLDRPGASLPWRN